MKKLVLFTTFFLIFSSASVFAKGAGGHSVGGSLIFISPAQDDMDTLIDRANSRAGGISTDHFSQGYEFALNYQYRFGGTIFAMMFRPSYFTQKTEGSGTGGSFDYSLSGWTMFPMLRLYPLENSFIKFFMQMGLGYGQIYGEITEGSAGVKFKSSQFGAMGGLGAEFCFTKEHCLALEGNLRYLPYERNKPTSTSGTPASGSFDGTGSEVEVDGADMFSTMSGVQATLGYQYYF